MSFFSTLLMKTHSLVRLFLLHPQSMSMMNSSTTSKRFLTLAHDIRNSNILSNESGTNNSSEKKQKTSIKLRPSTTSTAHILTSQDPYLKTPSPEDIS